MTQQPASADPFAQTDPFELAQRAAQALRERTGVETHEIALTLGSGWGGAADLLGETVAEIPAPEIPGFSKPALEGHVGTLRSIRLAAGRHALVIGARTHYYEGRGVRAVVHGV
ncbi:MAG: purine-nucleoside phosphorylase, partial [Micrococcales bacterium]|nr:purine-nucleoside phosphorylase [Micrococcales bacterium]